MVELEAAVDAAAPKDRPAIEAELHVARGEYRQAARAAGLRNALVHNAQEG